MFGYTIIKKDKLKKLEHGYDVWNGLCTYKWWFSGWPNVLDLLKSFSRGEFNGNSAWSIRHTFAKSMGTDEWGQKHDIAFHSLFAEAWKIQEGSAMMSSDAGEEWKEDIAKYFFQQGYEKGKM
jgi:hypothetical protein